MERRKFKGPPFMLPIHYYIDFLFISFKHLGKFKVSIKKTITTALSTVISAA